MESGDQRKVANGPGLTIYNNIDALELRAEIPELCRCSWLVVLDCDLPQATSHLPNSIHFDLPEYRCEDVSDQVSRGGGHGASARRPG